MFTGIIEQVGIIRDIQHLEGGKRFTIEAKFAPEVKIDQSISINGTCLTVVEHDETTFSVELIEETLRKTTHQKRYVGERVNLERAMLPTSRLDGHFVQGHVDTVGTIVGIQPESNSWLFTIQFPDAFRPYLIPVGSITIDGISLTVARLTDDTFTVAIIPYTYEHTNVSDWKYVMQEVNLEFDMMGKYVVGWLERQQKRA